MQLMFLLFSLTITFEKKRRIYSQAAVISSNSWLKAASRARHSQAKFLLSLEIELLGSFMNESVLYFFFFFFIKTVDKRQIYWIFMCDFFWIKAHRRIIEKITSTGGHIRVVLNILNLRQILWKNTSCSFVSPSQFFQRFVLFSFWGSYCSVSADRC